MMRCLPFRGGRLIDTGLSPASPTAPLRRFAARVGLFEAWLPLYSVAVMGPFFCATAPVR